MREIFSIRFFAAVGAVVGLFFLLTTIFATREVIEGDDGGPAPLVTHRIDLVDRIESSSNPAFGVLDGVAVADTVFTLDPSRAVRIVADTPAVDHCGAALARAGGCAVVADLLGEGVVWFALVPMGAGRSVELPAIDLLDDGLAQLVNGWQLPYAPVLDRRCDDEFASYREFRDALGDDFVALYDLDERRLTAVVCRRKVSYAPTTVPSAESSLASTTTPTTVASG